MKVLKDSNKEKGASIPLPDARKTWIVCLALGAVFWVLGLVLWWQGGIDKAVLFYYNPMRVANDPVVILSQWLSSSGMAVITAILVLYLLFSMKFKSLDAPLTVYFYTICSYGLSGIVGDILKEIFARPRPATTFASQILALSDAVTPALPSGHATKCVALILPFLLLVGNSKNIHKAVKIVIALIAVGICFSRIVLGAHYLSDVLAGIGMALVGLPISMLFANLLLRKMPPERLPMLSKIWGLLLIVLTYLFMLL
jgi:membrane-associated phospholipid phosphatase